MKKSVQYPRCYYNSYGCSKFYHSLYICFYPNNLRCNDEHLICVQEIITHKIQGKKLSKILNISAVLEKPTKLKTILLDSFKFWVPPNCFTLLLKLHLQKHTNLKISILKRLAIKGTSLGNVGRINALNK